MTKGAGTILVPGGTYAFKPAGGDGQFYANWTINNRLTSSSTARIDLANSLDLATGAASTSLPGSVPDRGTIPMANWQFSG